MVGGSNPHVLSSIHSSNGWTTVLDFYRGCCKPATCMIRSYHPLNKLAKRTIHVQSYDPRTDYCNFSMVDKTPLCFRQIALTGRVFLTPGITGKEKRLLGDTVQDSHRFQATTKQVGTASTTLDPQVWSNFPRHPLNTLTKPSKPPPPLPLTPPGPATPADFDRAASVASAPPPPSAPDLDDASGACGAL